MFVLPPVRQQQLNEQYTGQLDLLKNQIQQAGLPMPSEQIPVQGGMISPQATINYR